MHCPYCVSKISEQALVCPVCRRDLYLFKSLLERIESLEQRVAAQGALLAEGGQQLEEVASGSPFHVEPPPEEEEIPVLPNTREWLSHWLLPLALLPLALLPLALLALVVLLPLVALLLVLLPFALLPLVALLLLLPRLRPYRPCPALLSLGLMCGPVRPPCPILLLMFELVLRRLCP